MELEQASGQHAPKLTLSQTRELISQRTGDRRTVYWTKGKPGTYATASKYLGQWDNNKKHGKGTQTWASGDKYVGEWADGKPSGFGTYWKKSKKGLLKQYAGQFQAGHPHGRGVYYYDDGSVFDGQWRAGLRHGVGIMTFEDGAVYEGDWFNDKQHGFGVFDAANGDHFEGHFVEDKREGEGVLFFFSQVRAGRSAPRRAVRAWSRLACRLLCVYAQLCCRRRRARAATGRSRFQRASRAASAACVWPALTRLVRMRFAPPCPAQEKKVHHKRLDGEWVDGVCKCSVYSEMEPDLNVPASVRPEPLPKLFLVDADGVLATELRRIRAHRAHHRAARVTVDEHFTPEVRWRAQRTRGEAIHAQETLP